MANLKNCPDCGVEPGQEHKPGCDVERCPDCGRQVISCGCWCKCEDECIGNCNPTNPLLPWAGVWPGVAECIEYGWYVKGSKEQRGPDADTPTGEWPDLNRLIICSDWSVAEKRWRKREGC